jgi:hypothetical protein
VRLFFNDSSLLEVAEAHRAAFEGAQPFPHVVLDGVLNPEMLDIVLRDFPPVTSSAWKEYISHHERKLEAQGEDKLSNDICAVLYQFNSAPFLRFLEALTGIPRLLPDPYFDGGGLHQIQAGGKLGVHADFSRQPTLKLQRRLNILIYLNKEWETSYGGELELWNRDMTACVRRVEPIFNRMVVFRVTDDAYHGHPEPLRCPPGVTRKSIALYYYTTDRPAGETLERRNTTLFKLRPGDVSPAGVGDEDSGRRGRSRRAFKRFVPPILLDLVRWIRRGGTRR